MDNVKDYVELIKAPWGRMFYDLLFIQLNLSHTTKLNILDFGSGLGVTANHFARWHTVTAVEPNSEMIENSRKENFYTQIHGGVEKLSAFEGNTFDLILCHNVLEYIEEREPIIAELIRGLKPNGVLSVVKHNRAGRVFHNAVFWNDPQKASSLLDPHANDKSSYLGTQYIYSNSDIESWVKNHGGNIDKVCGMRSFWALGQDNSVKYTNEWYNNMLKLEKEAADIAEYRQTAFFNLLLIKKARGL
jgi:SAM-dependent methyltransferase